MIDDSRFGGAATIEVSMFKPGATSWSSRATARLSRGRAASPKAVLQFLTSEVTDRYGST